MTGATRSNLVLPMGGISYHRVPTGSRPDALLHSKLTAAMEIDVIAATERIEQVGGDPTRIDVAESFIRHRSQAVEDRARRIEDCAEDWLERDARLVARFPPA